MGSFAITYDDFTGGHYMGDKSAATPSNTWTGTNAALNAKGELVTGAVGKVAELATAYSPPNLGDANIYYGSIWGNNAIYIARWRDNGLLNQTTKMFRLLQMDVTPTTTTTTLVGEVAGKCAYVNDPATSSEYIYYADFSNGDIRRIDLSTNTDSLVSSVLATFVPQSIVDYKFRVIAYGGACYEKLFYSDATKTSFNATDYYEFPGTILNVVARSNDLLVLTTTGLYSAVGVFGSSLNIQQIMPTNELLEGMLDFKTSGRTSYFTGSTRIYEMVGATSFNLAYLDISDPVASFNVVQGGNVVVLSSSGAIYAKNQDGTFVRLLSSQNLSSYLDTFVAEPINLGKNFWDSFNRVSFAALNNSGKLEVYFGRYFSNYASPTVTGAPSTTPASSSVKLSEYWHQKPMVIREVLVEATYDTAATNGLTGNATISLAVKPVGAVDYTVNQTPALTSSTQTYTTSIASVAADNSRVLHRFRTDDAIRGYGFYPQITWQGCRIRRVIAVCED